MFDDAGLEQVLDRYPREKLGVFTMGEDPVDWRSWRRGAAGGLTGSQLLEAAKTGRIWLNLRAVNADLPDYAALSDEMFRDIEANGPGLRTFKRDVGLLISSANAQVFYHLDVSLVTLWQLRGQKRMYVYPPHAPFVGAEQLERIVLRETPEQLPYDRRLGRPRRGLRHDPRRHGHLATERTASHLQRPDAQCQPLGGVHDARRADAGQRDLRQRAPAPRRRR